MTRYEHQYALTVPLRFFLTRNFKLISFRIYELVYRTNMIVAHLYRLIHIQKLVYVHVMLE